MFSYFNDFITVFLFQAANAQHAAAMAALEAIQNQQKHAAVANAQQQQVQQATAALHQQNNLQKSFSSPLFGRNNSSGENGTNNNSHSNPSTPTLTTFEELKRRLTESSQNNNTQNQQNNGIKEAEGFSIPNPPNSSAFSNPGQLSSNSLLPQNSNSGPTPAKMAKLDFSNNPQISTINQLQTHLANSRQNLLNGENKTNLQQNVKKPEVNAPNFSGLKLDFGGGKYFALF